MYHFNCLLVLQTHVIARLEVFASVWRSHTDARRGRRCVVPLAVCKVLVVAARRAKREPSRARFATCRPRCVVSSPRAPSLPATARARTRAATRVCSLVQRRLKIRFLCVARACGVTRTRAWRTEDVVSAVEFDETGDFIAAGDKGGRIVVFERDHVSAAALWGFFFARDFALVCGVPCARTLVQWCPRVTVRLRDSVLLCARDYVVCVYVCVCALRVAVCSQSRRKSRAKKRCRSTSFTPSSRVTSPSSTISRAWKSKRRLTKYGRTVPADYLGFCDK